jgi:hypothetical protein
MKRKNHQLDRAPRQRAAPDATNDDLRVVTAKTTLDFGRWRCRTGTQIDAGRDKLLLSLTKGLRRLQPILADNTITAIYWNSLTVWFDFLDSTIGSALPMHCISDIDRHSVLAFIDWLQSRPANTKSGRLSPTTARSLYGGLKTVLVQCVATGELRRDCFPRQPFPKARHACKPPSPYTKEEMQAVLGALANDLRSIRAGFFSGNEADRLLVYFLLVAARTGRNPTSLFEMTRDAVRPHPLKPQTHSLLTTYKRRGNSILTLSIGKPHNVEEISVLAADTSALIRDVLDLTHELVVSAPPELHNYLWLYRRSRHLARWGAVSVFSQKVLSTAIKRFVGRHQLLVDNTDERVGGQVPLALSVMRLRKTFASRIWHLTGGDVAMTANLLGNRPDVTDTHYLAVTPEMVRNHHFLGKCLEIDLRGTARDAPTIARLAKEMKVALDEAKRIVAGENNTGVGRCSSPLDGRYAPKDGHTACTAFLHCFRCPNQVVMESDLYRMYSFYWLLVKERNLIGRSQWQKVYGWVIREIDRVIAPRFPPAVMKQAKERASVDPHPMWRDRSILLVQNHG